MSDRHRRKRYVAVEESARHDRWLLSYADFVTLLLAVFVLLAASAWQRHSIGSVSSAIQSGFQNLGAAATTEAAAQPQPKKAATLAPSESPAPAAPDVPPARACKSEPCPAATVAQPGELESQIRDALGNSLDEKEIVMQSVPDGVVVTLRELGLFRSGDATLIPEARRKLLAIGAVLKERGVDLRIEGHSDNQAIHSAHYRSNWELSTARAMSVLSLLVDRAGFPPERISAAGYGAYRPVASNATVEGRSNNRRIDLMIFTRSDPADRWEPASGEQAGVSQH